MANIDLLRASLFSSSAVLTGAHREEKGEYCKWGCNGRCCVAGGTGAGATDTEEDAEEFRGEGFLTLRGRIPICESFQLGGDAGSDDFAVREVKGALFETVQKRRSHVACGRSDSACSHCSFARSCKFSVFSPLSCAEARDESLGNKVEFELG
jgi:hypothetical protein